LTFSLFRQRFLFGINRFVVAQCSGQRLFVPFVGGVQRNRDIAFAPAPPTPAIARLIDRDAIYPGFSNSHRREATDALKSAQECFLRQVASLFRIGGQSIEQCVNITV